MEEKQNKNYISLVEAAKLCSYSEPYLRLRARQGKLKSIKLGKKWMTTAVWINDYVARAQEWQDKIAAKKDAAPVAVLAAAPLAAAADPGSGITPAKEIPMAAATIPAAPAEIANPAATLCSDIEPPLPPPLPKRLKAMPPAGQVFPVPEESRPGDVAGFGWFGALLSGAACALALFLAANWGQVPGIANIKPAPIDQANASRALALAGSVPADMAQEQVIAAEFPAQNAADRPSREPSENLLEKLVEWLARCFGGR